MRPWILVELANAGEIETSESCGCGQVFISIVKSTEHIDGDIEMYNTILRCNAHTKP